MIPEPFNSIACVLVGALFGALAWGSWCGCLARMLWRARWRRIEGRNGRVFDERPAGDTARFIAHQMAKRNADRAAMLKEASR